MASMATQHDSGDDFASAVLRARQAASAAGELAALERPAQALPLDEAEREAWQRLIDDGSFDRAVAAVADADPDVAG